jgi:uncharacterized membrane protein YgcG
VELVVLKMPVLVIAALVILVLVNLVLMKAVPVETVALVVALWDNHVLVKSALVILVPMVIARRVEANLVLLHREVKHDLKGPLINLYLVSSRIVGLGGKGGVSSGGSRRMKRWNVGGEGLSCITPVDIDIILTT